MPRRRNNRLVSAACYIMSRLSFMVGLICLVCGLVLPSHARAEMQANGAMIDDCQYASDAAAQAVWRPMADSAQVATALLDGHHVLRLPCNFTGTHIERASWDRKVTLDLASSRAVQFQILCRDVSPVSYFAIYFQSGEGWYSATFFPERSTGWNTIELDKKEFRPEGRPAGWNHVQTVRISAWRGKDTYTEFYLRGLRALPPEPPPGPRELAQAALARIGTLAGYSSYLDATNGIAGLAPRDQRVASALAQAAATRASALALLAQQKYGDAREQATVAADQLKKAFCLAQRPLPGEFRAFWCHSAFGLKDETWDEAIRRLADIGFTAILPNMLWGGTAFYDSKVLPVAAQVAERGDQIHQCVAACRKYGLQVHVWKVNWNLGSAAPKAFVDQMRREGRLQADQSGKEEHWLCPSHPANQQLEVAAMLEVARNYDVDGLHFDYIRYPNSDRCFCAGCKERFQRACGVTAQRWPQDVLAEGPLRQQWLDWRRGNITTVVKAVSEQAHALKPKIKVSAAVFRNWPTDRDAVGQDWKVWCDKGYLDFVCPMDYTPINSRFENMVAQQVQWAGRTPCYPGLGVSASSSHFGVDRAIEQINITRRYQTHGFVIFNYGVKESTELLPMLGMGITRKTGNASGQ